MRAFCFPFVVALLCALSGLAQTYNPKTIRLQGADAVDQTVVMRLIDLKPGTAVTKEQIEAAMQRMVDSGLFSDLSYKVGPDALVFVVTPVASAQALPVRYSNFVWWQPGELEPLVEGRVPLFHGKLPLTGQLTKQVEAALVALLAEKGVPEAHVSARLAMNVDGMILAVTQPAVTVGEIHLSGIAPQASSQMHNVLGRLSSQEFDRAETTEAIVNNTLDTHRNAGYLDVSVDPPVFSAPRKEMLGYAVDATATVHSGGLYRISTVTFEGVDPKLIPEVAQSSGVKAGDAAEEMTLRIGEGLTARACANHGMLEAKANAEVSKNSPAHTAAYYFTVVPGPVYTFAGVDVSALSPDVQTHFLREFRARPGVTADLALQTEMRHALASAGPTRAMTIEAHLDRSARTATFVITPKPEAGGVPGTS